MTRTWEKLNQDSYRFTLNNNTIGDMHLARNTTKQKASCTINNKEFTIQRTGFWKSNVEILDSDGSIVAKTYNEKWYANASILEYGTKKYKLSLHNNPLAEYRLSDGDKTLLAYGLDSKNNKISIKTTGHKTDSDMLLDFLLWYLFVPIATENMGDHLVFQMLLMS